MAINEALPSSRRAQVRGEFAVASAVTYMCVAYLSVHVRACVRVLLFA